MITLRFNQMREIVARYPEIGTCGHEIKAGDKIGWGKLGRWDTGQRCCTACWDKWKSDVASDDFDARMMGCE